MFKIASDYLIFSNKKYSRLTTTTDIKKIGKQWCILCKCDCGNMIYVTISNLRVSNTKSCGCLRNAECSRIGKLNIIHGFGSSKFYKIWNTMRHRCLNINDSHYKDYGSRGITVCDRWLKFENFQDDMYESYLKHVEEFGENNTSIDRIEVMGNYEPSNCRWSTKKEQARNRRTSTVTENYDDHRYWRERLSSHFSNALKFNIKVSQVLEPYLSLPIVEVRKYIESLWLSGMTWENYGNGEGKWNIDHIVGCNNFDLNKEEDRKRCWHYTNLRPMWYKDHRAKDIKCVDECK